VVAANARKTRTMCCTRSGSTYATGLVSSPFKTRTRECRRKGLTAKGTRGFLLGFLVTRYNIQNRYYITVISLGSPPYTVFCALAASGFSSLCCSPTTVVIISYCYLQVEKYFNSLPSNKVPKLGTSGEKYRDKQVVVQLPKQDLALTYCKHVEQRHHQSYEDFINARNEIALDIGYARECTYHVVSCFMAKHIQKKKKNKNNIMCEKFL